MMLFRKKRHIRIVSSAILFSMVLIGTCGPISSYAESEFASPYGYTVRVFGGNRGTVDGKGNGQYSEYSVNAYKGSISSEPSVEVTERPDKYYAKGYKESGKDNNYSASFIPLGNLEREQITKDTDYVVAYGMKDSAIPYHVNYIYQNPSTGVFESLYPQDNYNGNRGDQFTVRARYRDGYYPNVNAYRFGQNSDGTSGLQRETYITFIYTSTRVTPTPAPTSSASGGSSTTGGGTTTTTGGGTTIITGGGTTTTTGGGTTTTTGGGTTTTTGGTTGSGAAAGTSGGTTTTASNTNRPTANIDTGSIAGNQAIERAINRYYENGPRSQDEVQDIVDIDNAEVPLAEFEGSSSTSNSSSKSDSTSDKSKADKSTSVSSGSASSASSISELDTPTNGLSTMKKVGIGAGIAAAVGAVLGGFFLLRRRNEEDDEDDDE